MSAVTARELLGLEPFRLGKLGNFTALLRQHGILEPVTAAICQLARRDAAKITRRITAARFPDPNATLDGAHLKFPRPAH